MAYEKTFDIQVSDDLKNILKEIESESIVASLLLKKRHNKEDLVEDPVTYISISSQDKNRLSYLTSDRIKSLNVGEFWTSSRRYHAKPGSFISKIFKNISAKEIEKFSNLYKAEVNKPDFKFEVVKGEKVKEFYNWKTYCDNGRGTLGASCMKHDGCQKLLDVYSENSEVSMLIMLNGDGMLMGRALLWDFESYKIMDRIYTISDEELQFYFKKWATKNGYFYKSEQNWYNTLQFEQLGGKKVELYLDLKIKTDFRYLPYMDTFKFIDIDNGSLHNYIPKGANVRTLCATDGSRYDSDYLRFDSIDKVFRYRGESVYIDYLDIFTSERNTYWSNVNDKYILKKDGFYCEDINDYIFNDENNHMNNKERIEDLKKRIEEDRKRRESRSKSFSETTGLEVMNIEVERLANRIRVENLEQPIANDVEPTTEESDQLEAPIFIEETEATNAEETLDPVQTQQEAFENWARARLYGSFGIPRFYMGGQEVAIVGNQNEAQTEETQTEQNEESDV